MHSLMFLLVLVTITVPPAAKVLAIVAVVYAVIQGLKQAPWFAPYLNGWVAVLVNVLLSAGGVLVITSPDQLYTLATLQNLLLAILGSAGVHGTISKVMMGGKG